MPCKCMCNVDVVILRTPESAEGKQAKQFFDRKGVAYEDLDVTADAKALQRMQELSGQTERPVIVVDDQVFVGFDQERIEPRVPSFF